MGQLMSSTSEMIVQTVFLKRVNSETIGLAMCGQEWMLVTINRMNQKCSKIKDLVTCLVPKKIEALILARCHSFFLLLKLAVGRSSESQVLPQLAPASIRVLPWQLKLYDSGGDAATPCCRDEQLGSS